MSFNWLTILGVAADLLKKDGENYCRSSINRAYYAIFGITRQKIEEIIKEEFPKEKIHQQVIDYCIENPDFSYQQIGSVLDRLRRERVKADYNDDITITKDTALKAYKWAENLKTTIAAICL